MSAKRKIFRKSGYSEYKFRDEKNLTSRVLSAVASLGLAMAMPFGAEAAVGEITPAGNGAKVVSNGNVSSVYPGAVDKANDVAIGVYKNFDVNAGKIANMYFHKQGESHETSNLVNVVGNQININGTVNAIRNNTIGGNVYFLSSQGMMVGASGAINAGSLTVMTPNKKLIYGVMTGNALDAVTDEMVNKVVDLFTDDVDVDSKVFTNFATGSNWSKIQARTIPVNPSGTITVEGKINTLDGIYMKAPFIDIKAGAQLNTATEKVNGRYQKDFSQLVNIGNTESGLSADQDNLKVSTDAASGDVVLTAVADEINTPDPTASWLGNNKDGHNTIKAEITVGEEAKITSRSQIALTAEASNGTGQSGFFLTDLDKVPAAATVSDLVGTTAKTVASVDVKGILTGDSIDIEANADNTFVTGGLANLDSFIGNTIKNLLPSDSDVSYTVLENEATVNIGKNAILTATGTKESKTNESGEITEIGAINISASAKMLTSVNSGAAATKLAATKGKKNGKTEDPLGMIVPNAGVAYIETNNQANVTVAGKLKADQGSVDVRATGDVFLEAASAAEAPATTDQDANNFINAGIVIGDITNKSSINITNDITAGKSLGVAANTISSVSTSADTIAGENSLANTAVNITDVVTSADVKVAGNLTGGSVDVLAHNSIANAISANNAVGASKFAAQKAAKSSSVGSLLGQAKVKARKAPTGIEKVGEMFSLGASVVVFNDTNSANVTLADKTQLKATDGDVTVKALNEETDTQIFATGATNNYSKNTNTKALINASVLYGDINNDATVVVQGSTTSDTATKLTGKHVTVNATTDFSNDRFNNGLVDSIGDSKGKIQPVIDTLTDDYAGLKEQWSDVLASVDDYKNNKNISNLLDVCAKLSSFSETLADDINLATVQELHTALTGVQDLLALPMQFINAASYANFYVASSTGGKASGGSGNGDAAKVAVAGSVNINNLASNAKVVIGKNSQLIGTEAGDTAAVDVGAVASQKDIVLNGKVKYIIPKQGSAGADTAVGGNVGVHTTDVNSLVVIGEGANLAGPRIDINADNAVDNVAVTFGGGKDASTGVTGMVSYMNGNSNSIVAVDDEAKLQTGSSADLNLKAVNNTVIWNVVADKTSASGTALGASVGVVDYNINNIAAIADVDKDASRSTTGETSDLNNLINGMLKTSPVAVSGIGDNYDAVTALQTEIAALAASDKTEAEKAQLKAGYQAQLNEFEAIDKGKYATVLADTEVSLAEARANNDSDLIQYYAAKKAYLEKINADNSIVAKQLTVGQAEDLTDVLGTKAVSETGSIQAANANIEALTDSQINTISVAGVSTGGSKEKSGGKKSSSLPINISGAGSASVNIVKGQTGALLEGIAVDLNNNNLNVSAEDDSFIGAYSGAAALQKQGQKQGSGASDTLVGAIGYNQIEKETSAQIKDTTINNVSAITNKAMNGGAALAAGLALGSQSSSSSGSSGISAAVSGSYNDSTNKIHAVLDNIKVNNSAGAGSAQTTLQNIAYDKDLQVAGGLTLSKSSGNLGVGVAGSYLTANNDIKAAISGSTFGPMSIFSTK